MFLYSYIFILLIFEVRIFADTEIRHHAIDADANKIKNLSEYSGKNSSFKPTLNLTNEFPTSVSEEYDHTNDGESWEDWIFELLERFSGTVTCIVAICAVFCIFCSLQCILGIREPSWFAKMEWRIFLRKCIVKVASYILLFRYVHFYQDANNAHW